MGNIGIFMINEPEDKTENTKLWWEELMDQYSFILDIEPNSDLNNTE